MSSPEGKALGSGHCYGEDQKPFIADQKPFIGDPNGDHKPPFADFCPNSNGGDLNGGANGGASVPPQPQVSTPQPPPNGLPNGLYSPYANPSGVMGATPLLLPLQLDALPFEQSVLACPSISRLPVLRKASGTRPKRRSSRAAKCSSTRERRPASRAPSTPAGSCRNSRSSSKTPPIWLFRNVRNSRTSSACLKLRSKSGSKTDARRRRRSAAEGAAVRVAIPATRTRTNTTVPPGSAGALSSNGGSAACGGSTDESEINPAQMLSNQPSSSSLAMPQPQAQVNGVSAMITPHTPISQPGSGAVLGPIMPPNISPTTSALSHPSHPQLQMNPLMQAPFAPGMIMPPNDWTQSMLQPPFYPAKTDEPLDFKAYSSYDPSVNSYYMNHFSQYPQPPYHSNY
ncbi:hypothetical protein M3Y99_00313100 [Aphelenchoides fujianensis]|nr:hypothetical protein M3Y99_00313100 [Aphelenchoides fujianensis]